VTRGGDTTRWEPFASRDGVDGRSVRTLYKDALSTTLVFEEIRPDLGLVFCAAWQTSPRFGFVRSCRLVNLAAVPCTVRVLDGLQNLLPHGVSPALQSGYSNLFDAYKRASLIALGAVEAQCVLARIEPLGALAR
jgi:hypothetical protein